MTDKSYKDALHSAQAELVKVEHRKATLLQLIESLKTLSEDPLYELIPPAGYVAKGLTDEIRTILTLTMDFMEPTQIRDALVLRRFPHPSTKNLLINVHTVLKRIKSELEEDRRNGKTVYRLRQPSSLEEFTRRVSLED